MERRPKRDLTKLCQEWERKDAERTIVQSSIDRLRHVRSMNRVFLVLGAFAIVGIVQPLVLMTRRPIAATPRWRDWIVVTFTLAMGALLWSLWSEVRALRKPAGAQAADG